MPDAAYAAAQALVSWLVVAVFASQIAALTYPAFRSVAARGNPSSRALAQVFYGAMAPLAATLSVVLIMHPDWAAILVPQHCHGEVCDPHRPEVSMAHPAGATLLAGSFAVVLLVAMRFHATIQHARGRLRALRMLSETPAEHQRYAVVGNEKPLAWCAGFLWPRVYVSSGLLAELAQRSSARSWLMSTPTPAAGITCVRSCCGG